MTAKSRLTTRCGCCSRTRPLTAEAVIALAQASSGVAGPDGGRRGAAGFNGVRCPVDSQEETHGEEATPTRYAGRNEPVRRSG